MTKKFWHDWQTRKGDTKNVFTVSGALIRNPNAEIWKIEFDNDYVYITILHYYTKLSNGDDHYCQALSRRGFHRTEIKSAEFIKEIK